MAGAAVAAVKSLPENDVLLKRASNNYLELESGAFGNNAVP